MMMFFAPMFIMVKRFCSLQQLGIFILREGMKQSGRNYPGSSFLRIGEEAACGEGENGVRGVL